MPTNLSSSVLNDWLGSASKELLQAGVATCRLDCLVLLEDITKKDRSYLLAHPEIALPKADVEKLNRMVERRKNHEPLAYIRGKSEFYGREFKVNKHTLQPRPETETMIDLLKQILHSQKPHLLQDSLVTDGGNVNWRIVDVGTGSGCIGITAKLEIPEAEVIGVDVSEQCLQVARQNAKKLSAEVKLYQGDLLEPILSSDRYPLTAILANLPYVPDGHTINQAAMQEPKIAIFGGPDGLGLYRRMFAQIKEYALAPRLILTESLPFQHLELSNIAAAHGYKLQKEDDFIQAFSL